MKLAILFVSSIWMTSLCSMGQIEVMKHAISRADSAQARPLEDALDAGFNSAEVDLWLVEGSLLIGETRSDTSLDRTLESIYLEPLKVIAERNAGKIFPDSPAFTLFLNLHSEANPSYAALKKSIGPYQDLLTRFTDTTTEERGITIIISGNVPREVVSAEASRFVGLEGKIQELNGALNTNLVPVIGDDWNYWFRWDGETTMTEQQRSRLKQAVEVAHHYKMKIRFHGAPDAPFAWFEFYEAGVDFIASSDIDELQKFLKGAYQRKRSMEAFRKANEEMIQKLTPQLPE